MIPNPMRDVQVVNFLGEFANVDELQYLKRVLPNNYDETRSYRKMTWHFPVAARFIIIVWKDSLQVLQFINVGKLTQKIYHLNIPHGIRNHIILQSCA